jgi:hypothetical protein
METLPYPLPQEGHCVWGPCHIHCHNGAPGMGTLPHPLPQEGSGPQVGSSFSSFVVQQPASTDFVENSSFLLAPLSVIVAETAFVLLLVYWPLPTNGTVCRQYNTFTLQLAICVCY